MKRVVSLEFTDRAISQKVRLTAAKIDCTWKHRHGNNIANIDVAALNAVNESIATTLSEFS